MAPFLELCCLKHLNCKNLGFWNRAAGWAEQHRQTQLLWGKLRVMHDTIADAWSKCSAEVNRHWPTHFSELLQLSVALWLLQGCQGKEGQSMSFGREVVHGPSGAMCWELPRMVPSWLVVRVFASKQRRQVLCHLITGPGFIQGPILEAWHLISPQHLGYP